MSVETAVTAGRVAAEALMSDTCTVTYRTGHTVQDETTGREVPQTAVRFTSACKVQSQSMADVAPRTSRAGDREVTTLPRSVHMPVTAPEVYVDDVVTITAVGAFSDPQLVGTRFRVLSSAAKTYATARRIPVEEVVG